jgi:large subunit ribosomal protein L32e
MKEVKKTPIVKKKPKFLRRKNKAYSKLGKGRKKKQIWRRPTGRDNKMREKKKGHPVSVSIGYKSTDKKEAIVVKNISELENAKMNEIIIAKVGKKKKLEIANKAKEMKIKIKNMNPEIYLKRNAPKGVPRDISKEMSTKGKKSEEAKK